MKLGTFSTISLYAFETLTFSHSSALDWNLVRVHTIKQLPRAEADPGRISPPKIYESNYTRHNFVQFEKEHSRYKAILSSIVLS